jgi:cellulose synthase/poly-beta-1,6-N-acetylglucosamine synthase-like glycosyltransferase
MHMDAPVDTQGNHRQPLGTVPESAAAATALGRPGRPAQSGRVGAKRLRPSARQRRQWGSDRRSRAPLTVPKPASDSRIAAGRLAIVVTVAAWLAYLGAWLFDDFFRPGYDGAGARAEEIVYLLIVTLLTVSALAYLLSRLGFFYRTRTHHRATRATLDEFFDARQPTLTAIIPSYQEEERVIRTALLSAALQEYPGKRVVLLIDDPATPRTRAARDLLRSARALPGAVQELLAGPAGRSAAAMRAFEAAMERGQQPGPGSMITLADAYAEAVEWLEALAEEQEIIDHADSFFVNENVLRLAASLGEVKAALLESAGEGVVLRPQMFRRLYRRLAWTFSAELSSFERKRYASLSHEPNKAMNLNSYIGLMGTTCREAWTAGGTALVPAEPGAGLPIPDPDYVVTLDADSVLLPEYCLRLVHLLEQQEYQDIAIAQTPYSAFPGSATRLERIAGSTTDLQHIVHLGLTYYDATFWVGANAVIRKKALDDIAETSYIGDWEIKRYVKDRTVIEDTESTVDMGVHGWRLFNYPERLSYSATPPDFGALCIQRRRWANGGLLVLPKLLRQSRARRARGKRVQFGELFLRWNYIASISWSSVSLLILLAFPFSATLISPLLALIALPYFAAMASDLRYCGYKRLDVLRVYGLNLILLGVNLAGTLSSVVQGITASKATFTRTPKVRERTVVPLFPLTAPYLVIVLGGLTFYHAYLKHRTESMCYAGLNVILACYAAVAFIGLRNSIVDLSIHGTSLLMKSAERRSRSLILRQRPVEQPGPADWRTVLQAGYEQPGHRAAGPPPTGPQPGDALPDGPPRRRLSLTRLLVALVVLAGTGCGGYLGVTARLFTHVTAVRQTWFGPYVDVTLTPTYQFQSTADNPARQSVLGFVVASSTSSCTPSWGAAYSLMAADQQLAVGPRIAQLQQEGEQAIVSFGGGAHTSLDVACPTAATLTAAYQSVIRAYHLTAIDLDIEGRALANVAAAGRRAQAIARLERTNPGLKVWLTLPVATSGLRDNALSVIGSMLRAHASLSGVNVMSMDFSSPPGRGSTMAQYAQDALQAAEGQLAALFPRYGINLRPRQIWQRLGVTVMIGQNDIAGENFTVSDARALTAFAAKSNLGRVSMWSINRDSQCGSSFPEIGVHSNTCSGTAESTLGFARVFGELRGGVTAAPDAGSIQPAVADTKPADAPYPQWSPDASYPLGYKIVEAGEIYQALWFNTGQDPAAQFEGMAQGPWELIGPVLPGDHGPHIARLPAGTYPAWSLRAQYQADETVLYARLPYRAKWSNQGISPASQSTDPSGSPWQALFGIPGEPAGAPVLGPLPQADSAPAPERTGAGQAGERARPGRLRRPSTESA